MKKTLSLDVDAPHKVAEVLLTAAEVYRESAVELEAAWQDQGAGKPWSAIAATLEKAAGEIDGKLKRMRY